MPSIKIIGLGNPCCGDDAVGVEIARQLQSMRNDSVVIVEGGLTGLNLLHEMEGIHTLILVDAVQSGAEVGTIVRLRIPADFPSLQNLHWGSSLSSTHAIGLLEALQLAETLNVLPPETLLYGIELGHLNKGEALSPQVKTSMATVIHRIFTQDVRDTTCMKSN